MARFVQIAIGSASEVESQLLVAQRLGFIRDVESLGNDVDHIRRRLIRLLQSIEANEPRSS